MRNSENGKRYLTPREVSERYGGSISVGTLANMRSAGVSPPYKKIGGKVLYFVEDLEKWEQHRTFNGTHQYRR